MSSVPFDKRPPYADVQCGDFVWMMEQLLGIVEQVHTSDSPFAVKYGMANGGGVIRTEWGFRVIYDISRLCSESGGTGVCLECFHYAHGDKRSVAAGELYEGLELKICFEGLAKITQVFSPNEERPGGGRSPNPCFELTYYGMNEYLRYPVVQEWVSGWIRKAKGGKMPAAWVEGDREILLSHLT